MLSGFISRIQQIDRLLKIKGRSTPDEFTIRLEISRRGQYVLMNKMKDKGVFIKYDHYRSSSYYAEEGSLRLILLLVGTGFLMT